MLKNLGRLDLSSLISKGACYRSRLDPRQTDRGRVYLVTLKQTSVGCGVGSDDIPHRSKRSRPIDPPYWTILSQPFLYLSSPHPRQFPFRFQTFLDFCLTRRAKLPPRFTFDVALGCVRIILSDCSTRESHEQSFKRLIYRDNDDSRDVTKRGF